MPVERFCFASAGRVRFQDFLEGNSLLASNADDANTPYEGETVINHGPITPNHQGAVSSTVSQEQCAPHTCIVFGH